MGFSLFYFTASIELQIVAMWLFYLVIVQYCLFIRVITESSSIFAAYCGCYHTA